MKSPYGTKTRNGLSSSAAQYKPGSDLERVPEKALGRTRQNTVSQYVRLHDLLTMVPMSASSIWRKCREGTFVKPVKLSARITAWNREAVDQWLRDQEAM